MVSDGDSEGTGVKRGPAAQDQPAPVSDSGKT